MVFVMYVVWKRLKLLEKLKGAVEPKLDQLIYTNLDALSIGNQDKKNITYLIVSRLNSLQHLGLLKLLYRLTDHARLLRFSEVFAA